ncbi:hypothetical protein Tco_0493799 [Tanacetum coccineum]
MSTSKTYQQSLADCRRYLNRKRDNRKWLLKALDEGPYEFKNFVHEGSTIPRLQTAEDLEGDDLLLHADEMELVYASRAKKLEKSHDPLALVARTSLSSRQTSFYYATHPTSVVDYDDEYQQDDVQNNSEDPLVSAMLLLAKAITQNFSNLTNNRILANTEEIAGRLMFRKEVVEGMNAPKETGNVQRTLRTPSSGNTSTVQCYNYSGKGHYARNFPKPRVRDSKYFMEQMLLAKQDEAGVILTDEQFFFEQQLY